MNQHRRVLTLHGLQIGLLALVATETAHAQFTPIDFRVVHLPRTPAAAEHYVAIRTQEAWAALRSGYSKLPNAPSIPKIDFKQFILLIANTGVKPSSGYKIIFDSVDVAPAPSNKMATTVHVIEMTPGNCPALAHLADSASYALIPQTTNEIRFVITKADSNCAGP